MNCRRLAVWTILSGSFGCAGVAQEDPLGASGGQADKAGGETKLRYGDRVLDVRSFIGVGDPYIPFLNDPQSNDLYWIKSGDHDSRIVRLPFKGGTWDESAGKEVFTFGQRSFWSPKYNAATNSFLFISDENNDETFNVYQFVTTPSKLTKVTSAGFAFGFAVSSQTNHLIYTGRQDQAGGGMTCLEELDIAAPENVQKLFCDDVKASFYAYADPIIDGGDKRIATVLTKGGARNLGVYRRQTKRMDIITDETIGRNTLEPIVWKGDRLYFVSDEGTDRVSLYVYDDATRKIDLLRQNPGHSVAYFYDAASARIVLVEGDGTKSNLVVFDTTADRAGLQADASAFLLELPYLFQPLAGGAYAIMASSTKSQSKFIVSVNPSATRSEDLIRPIFEPEASKRMLPPCPLEDIKYETFDTGEDGKPRMIEGVLFKPTVETKVPAGMIYAHGGPAQTLGHEAVPEIQALCHLGYYVLGANVRGSSNLGKAWEDLNKNDWGGGDYKDYEYARRYLTQAFSIDPARVGIYGHSYGGYMTNWAITRPDTKFSFGISLSGMSDLVAMGRESNVSGGNSEMEDPKVLQYNIERSPLTWAMYLNHPLLLIHGDKDTRVPTNQSRVFNKALKMLNKDVDYMEEKGEGHQFKYVGTQTRMYQRMYDFLYRIAPLELK